MRKLNSILHVYFIDENGIDNLFKFVTQVVASAALFRLVSFLSKNNLPVAIITAMLSLTFLSLALYSGLHKFWIPLIKKIHGNRENISRFEVLGGARNFFKPDVILAFLGCVAFFYLVNLWFDAVYKIALK
jgi:hypothetical protein